MEAETNGPSKLLDGPDPVKNFVVLLYLCCLLRDDPYFIVSDLEKTTFNCIAPAHSGGAKPKFALSKQGHQWRVTLQDSNFAVERGSDD